MSRPTFLADTLRRLLAAGCALLVLALTIVAASPSAHAWFHEAEQAHTCPHHPPADPKPAPAEAAGHDCAVVLFASGVDLDVGPLALFPPATVAGAVSPVTAAAPDLVAPRYLRQPERGPPARS